MKERVPKTRAGKTWTEARFWSFLRSALRLASRKWPPRRIALEASRRSYDGPNVRQKWEYQCAVCGRWWSAKQIEVDHISPCGSLRSFGDLATFAERLFCEAEHLRVVDKVCHKLLTSRQ